MKTQWVAGQLPLFVPDSDWVCPTELPDLTNVRLVALDTETRDDCLGVGMGPGWHTKSGFIAGISVAWNNGNIYIPIRHPDTNCFDHSVVGSWLKKLFSQDQTTFIFHNANYDLGWIWKEWGLKTPKKLGETGVMASLVNENLPSYRLDDLCKWRGLQGKDERLLQEAAATYGFKDLKANMWKLPARYVGIYAEADALQTALLSESLQPEITEQELEEAYRLEVDLVPMVFEMCKRGIRVDTSRAEQAQSRLLTKRNLAISQLSEKLGQTIGIAEINSARHIEKWFVGLNIPFGRTAKSLQGKFDSEFLEKHDHWLPKAISEIRQLEVAQSKFLQGFILDFAHNGRIYASINQFRNEDGGTRSHRFSYSSPPLQQMPARNQTPLKEELVAEIRGCFLPEDGEMWCSADYKQQEYKMMVHYAELLKARKATQAGDKFRNDPATDFHKMVAELTGLPRKRAKDVNFAKAFGAGVAKFALMTGMSLEEAKSTMEQYDVEMPFIKESSDICKRRAEQLGFIRLIDGARSHFDQWEPSYRNRVEEQEYRGELGTAPCQLEVAMRRVEDPNHPWNGRLVRSYTHKSFNRLIQGSAARQTKMAMRDCWNAGFIPLLQIHDELCFSVTDPEQGRRIAELMSNTVRLTVPTSVDLEYGYSWGTARVVEDKEKNTLYSASWSDALRLKEFGKWW